MTRHVWDELDSDLDGLDPVEEAPDYPWPVAVIVLAVAWLLMIVAGVLYTVTHINCRADLPDHSRITCHER